MRYIADDSEFVTHIASKSNVLAEFPDLGYSTEPNGLDEVLVVLDSLVTADALSFASVGDGHECWRGVDLTQDQVAALHETLGKWLESRP